MRDIKIKVNDEGYVSAYEKFIGNQYEHEATRLLFELPESYKGNNLFQYVVFTLCDGTVKIRQMVDDACIIDRDITNVTGLLLMEVVIKNIENAEDLTTGKVMNSQAISGFIKPASYNPDKIISESIDRNVLLYLDEFNALLAEIRKADARFAKITEASSSMAEVIDARGRYNLLANRLGDMSNDISNSKNKISNLSILLSENYNTLNQKINSVSSGSPLKANSVSEMTDTARTYVNISDGNWYYYTGTKWEIGGVYQATEIGDDTVTLSNLTSDIIQAITSPIDIKPDYTTNSGYLTVTTGGNINININVTWIKYWIIPVEPKQKFNIKTFLGTAIKSYGYIFTNDNGKALDYDMYGETYNFDNPLDIVAPNGATKLYVQLTDTTKECKIKKYKLYNAKDGDDNLQERIDDISKYETSILKDEYKSYGYFNGSAGSKIDTSNTSTVWTKWIIPVTEGQRVTVKTFMPNNAQAYGYSTLDENDIIVNTGMRGLNYDFNNPLDLIIPEGVVKLAVQIRNDAGYICSVTSKVMYDVKAHDDSIILLVNDETNNRVINENENKFEVENLQRRCNSLENSNPFAWKDFDKSYFAFVIDDCNSFTPICADLFNELNVPLGFATIITNLDRVWDTAKGRTIKEILKTSVEKGGEVLAHYSGNLAPEGTPDTEKTHYQTSYNDWKIRTRDVKKKLEENGFNVRGLILADSSIANTETGQKWCSLYFDYADRVGTSPNFNLGHRKFFIGVNTLDEMKSYIDASCRTPGFYPFCLHGNRADEPLATVENLTEIINYIKSKGSSVAVITTYNSVFSEFGTTQLEKRINSLENK